MLIVKMCDFLFFFSFFSCFIFFFVCLHCSGLFLKRRLEEIFRFNDSRCLREENRLLSLVDEIVEAHKKIADALEQTASTVSLLFSVLGSIG